MSEIGFLTGDFDGALSVLTEMAYFAEERGSMGQHQEKIQGPYQEILAHCEIGRVLLLMLLQPTPQRIRPQHAQILEKYSEGNVGGGPMEYMSRDLFLLLQSCCYGLSGAWCRCSERTGNRTVGLSWAWATTSASSDHLKTIKQRRIKFT